jgi:hypothetical protein
MLISVFYLSPFPLLHWLLISLPLLGF